MPIAVQPAPSTSCSPAASLRVASRLAHPARFRRVPTMAHRPQLGPAEKVDRLRKEAWETRTKALALGLLRPSVGGSVTTVAAAISTANVTLALGVMRATAAAVERTHGTDAVMVAALIVQGGTFGLVAGVALPAWMNRLQRGVKVQVLKFTVGPEASAQRLNRKADHLAARIETLRLKR